MNESSLDIIESEVREFDMPMAPAAKFESNATFDKKGRIVVPDAYLKQKWKLLPSDCKHVPRPANYLWRNDWKL